MIPLGCEKVDPAAVPGLGNLARIAAVAAKHRLVGVDIEMDGPFVPAEGIFLFLTGGDIHCPQVEGLALGYLPVEIDRFAVGAEELMPGYLVLYRPFVHQPHLTRSHPDGPDAIYLL